MPNLRPVDLVCIGDIVIDLVSAEGSLKDAGHFRRFLGGSACNIAVDFTALGGEAGLVAGVGDDPFGRHALETLAIKGVRVGGVRVVAGGRTPLAFVADVQGEPDYLPVRDGTVGLRLEDAEMEQILRAEMLHISAACLADEANFAALGRLLDLKERGGRPRVIGVDLGFIPRFHSRATLLERLPAIAPRVTFLKISHREAEGLFWEARDPEATLERLREIGFRKAVLSLGAEGWIADTGGRVARGEAVSGGRVRNVSGAGDAMTAGIFIGMLTGLPFEEAVYAAAKYARMAVTRWEPQF